MDELETKRRDSVAFQKAQNIVALLEGLEPGTIKNSFKLAQDILQCKEQKAIALVTYRKVR
jgi:hypothetical protein